MFSSCFKVSEILKNKLFCAHRLSSHKKNDVSQTNSHFDVETTLVGKYILTFLATASVIKQ